VYSAAINILYKKENYLLYLVNLEHIFLSLNSHNNYCNSNVTLHCITLQRTISDKCDIWFSFAFCSLRIFCYFRHWSYI